MLVLRPVLRLTLHHVAQREEQTARGSEAQVGSFELPPAWVKLHMSSVSRVSLSERRRKQVSCIHVY